MLAPTVKIAHTGLMNLLGHRANILHASSGRLGIGILYGGYRGIMVSQEFRNQPRAAVKFIHGEAAEGWWR